MFDFMVSKRPWRLFEIADQPWFPGFLRRRCQSTLAAQWAHRLPLLQSRSPALLAADLIAATLDEIADAENLTVVDFCSGGGGPTPVIERAVNAARAAHARPPVQFLLSDLHPSLDAWIDLAQQSEHLSFVPQPVDAARPPPAAASRPSSGTKVLRTFALSFHHFDDRLAAAVLRSALDGADAVALLELQDRSPKSLALMLLDWPLLLLVSLPWFWWDPLRLLFTYPLPLLPAVHAFDGFVSCLRTRTFDEVVELLIPPARQGHEGPADYGAISGDGGGWRVEARTPDEVELVNGDGVRWVLRGGRRQHTWPIGYMNYVLGVRQPETT